MSEQPTTIAREVRPEVLGSPGERCLRCGAPLAEDQRYCVNCGERRGERRVPLPEVEKRTIIPLSHESAKSEGLFASLLSTPLSIGAAAAGLALLGFALLIGVLIGNSGDSNNPAPVAAARPQVITVATPGAGATNNAEQSFTSDWPDGTDGFTVQLQELSKDSSDPAAVASAKLDAQSKGAAGVGALDSDDFASLDGGSYVVYSGVFKSKAAAAKTLKKLKHDFPDAKVIKVGATGGASGGGKKVDKSKLKDLQQSSPQDYQKKSRKLPDKLKLPGKPPPKDNKKPGGGGKVETIG